MPNQAPRLPSFPQRGQLPMGNVLDMPDDAPAQLRGWTEKITLSQQLVRWFGLVKAVIDELIARTPGVAPAVIPLAKITGGGTAGSITINEFGVVTAYTPPT